jgi:hypothetical protein
MQKSGVVHSNKFCPSPVWAWSVAMTTREIVVPKTVAPVENRKILRFMVARPVK